MKKCPICGVALRDPFPDFCENCGWELGNDPMLVPSLDLPKSAVEDYKKQAGIYRRNWMKMLEAIKQSEVLEERIREMEAVRNSPVADRPLCVEKRPSGRFGIDKTYARETSSASKAPGSVWVEPETGMEFVYVPGGTFEMGDLFGDGHSSEKPVHTVRLDPYYIGKYPVTQGQWKKVTGENPSLFKKGDDYPVEMISWDDAKAFIKKRGNMNGGKFRLCLPTEAQWEYAARSGGKRERYSGGDKVEDVAWYSENSGESTHPVGLKKPNGLGIYDMSGNVMEWCEDIYGEHAYKKHGSGNPIYAGGGFRRVLRGGSWHNGPAYARCSHRYDYSPGYRNVYVGFRLARTI